MKKKAMAEQTKTELKYDIYQPFGPSILKVKLPQNYVNLLNAEADHILHDEKLSKDHDWSHNLAGNVKKEIAIDQNKITGFPEFLITMAKVYYKHTINKEPADGSKLYVVNGFNSFAASGEKCLMSMTLDIKIDAGKIPGIPKFLAKGILPKKLFCFF